MLASTKVVSTSPKAEGHHISAHHPSIDANCSLVEAKDKAAAAAGVEVKKADGAAQQAAGEAKGKAAELAGQAKGKAEEVKGKLQS